MNTEQRLLDAQRAVDVDGYVDEARGIRYVGRAVLQSDGKWRCLAVVGGALCTVEVTITGTLARVPPGGDAA